MATKRATHPAADAPAADTPPDAAAADTAPVEKAHIGRKADGPPEDAYSQRSGPDSPSAADLRKGRSS